MTATPDSDINSGLTTDFETEIGVGIGATVVRIKLLVARRDKSIIRSKNISKLLVMFHGQHKGDGC